MLTVLCVVENGLWARNTNEGNLRDSRSMTPYHSREVNIIRENLYLMTDGHL